MDHKFTEQLGKWLSASPSERDIEQGAVMLLQLSGNRIRHASIMLNPAKYAETVEYELRKYYKVRVAAFTHEEVQQMQAQADKIARARSLTVDNPDKGFKGGKRGDHDKLPTEVQALYVENLSLLQRMRELHTRLRIISDDQSDKFCPDSDRYPLLKELISLDKKMRENWEQYDNYSVKSGKASIPVDTRELSKQCCRMVNLNKGKYRKSPNETLAAQLRDWYANIINPTAKLTEELTELGIL